VKRDIMAALTFLVTGYLFYLVQTAPELGPMARSGGSGGAQSTYVTESLAPHLTPTVELPGPEREG